MAESFFSMTMKYSFYWKFALNIKLNVNIVALIGSRLEINMNKQEKLIQQYPRNSTDGFQYSENVEQTLTAKRIGGKLKTIRTNFNKAVDTSKRSGDGRVVLTFYGLCEKLWSGSPAVKSIENSIDTSSSTNQSTESTGNNDSKNMTPLSDTGTGYALESGSNFEESNYSDEATERRSKIRKLHKSEKLSSKSSAEAQMLQCYKDDLKSKMISKVK